MHERWIGERSCIRFQTITDYVTTSRVSAATLQGINLMAADKDLSLNFLASTPILPAHVDWRQGS